MDSDSPIDDPLEPQHPAYWKVQDWDSGTVEFVSSGAALFDSSHRVVGQLRGGNPADLCEEPDPAWFGKFAEAWDTSGFGGVGGGQPSTQLQPWLDPDCVALRDPSRLVLDGREAGQFPNGCNTVSDLSAGTEVIESGSDTRVAGDRSLAWGCDQFGMTWMDDSDGEVYFARLTPSMQLISGSVVQVTSAGGESAFPSIEWNGAHFGVVWHDMRDNPYGEIYFQLLDGDGALLDTNGGSAGTALRLTTDGTNNYSLYPDVSWTGSRWGVAWDHLSPSSNGYQIRFMQLPAVPVAPGSTKNVTSTAGHSLFPSLVWSGEVFGVAWHDGRNGSYEVYFARLDHDGDKIGLEVAVTSDDGAGSEFVSLATTGPYGFGVTWHDFRDGSWQVYFAALDAVGTVQHGPLNVSDSSGDALSPSLAWGSGEYGVSWRDNRFDDGSGPVENYETLFTRLTPSGGEADVVQRVSSSQDLSFWSSLAWSGLEFGVLWNEGAENDIESIHGRRIGCCKDSDLDLVNVCPFDPRSNPLGGDCDDTNPNTFPGAGEVNDGADNQCPGDAGYGEVDEVSSLTASADSSMFRLYWPVQEGADEYEIARSESPLFDDDCQLFAATGGSWSDPTTPDGARAFFYLVRATSPFGGSWGLNSAGAERTVACDLVSASFFDDFDRTDSNSVGNGWAELELVSSPDSARILTNRLNFPDADAAVAYRPNGGDAGRRNVSVTWLFRKGSDSTNLMEVDAVSVAHNGLIQNARHGLNVRWSVGAGSIEIADENDVQGGASFPFTLDTDYRFEWNVCSDYSSSVRVWRSSDERPTLPVVESGAFLPESLFSFWAIGNRFSAFFDDFRVESPARDCE